MADQRTFTLIGEFQDGITPELEKINNAINIFKRNMMTMTSRRGGGFSDVTQSVGKLVSAQKHLSNSIKEVGDAAKAATGELKEYNRMVGKVASAHYHIGKSGQSAGNRIAKDWESAGKSLDGYARRITRLSTMGRRTRLRMPEAPYAAEPRTPRTPRAPRAMAPGGGGNGPRPPRGGGGGGGDGYNFHMGAFAFGMQLGQGISQPVTAAVLSGFQLGVGLLQQSFSYISNAFAERVKDEMSDLSAAGGYYSIAQRQKDPFVKTLQDAVDFTQETNAIMARLASSLPGETQDYVEVSKRIGDSVGRLVASNEKGAIAYAQKLREGQEDIYKTPLTGPESRKGAMQVILGELTKKTVMAGFGGSAGVGGARGPHGLPGLTERMLTDPTISMGKLSRYAAVFGDPKISSALERYLPKLEAAGPDMLKRAKILNEMYDEVVPPEMIAAMRTSMAGMMEAFNSAFLNPEVGFLGIGRKLQAFAPKMNLYGQFIDKTGKVVEDAAFAAKADIGIYEMFRDIIANFGAVLMPIVDNLSAMWDPMRAIGEALQEARIFSSKFLTWFRNYDQGLKDYAKTLSKEDAEKILSTRNLRASLATINNLFRQLGIFSSAEFKNIGTQLMDPSKGIKELGQIASSLMKTFFESDAAKKLGEFVGNLLGTIVVQISQMTGFLAKRLTGGKLGEGFGKAFEESGGVAALKQIFNDLYKLVWEAFVFAVKALPLDLILKVGLATILVPAAISGIGMMIGQFMTELISKLFRGCFSDNLMGKVLGRVPCDISGGAADGARAAGMGGEERNSKLRRRRNRMSRFFITEAGEAKAKNMRGAVRSTLQTPYAGQIGPLPPHSFYKGERTSRMHPGMTGVGRMQQALGVPRRMYKRVGAAPISPVMQAMGGMLQGKGGERALIRQRNMAGAAARGMAKMGRFVPGGALAFGGIDAAVRMASGEDAGRAIGGAAASTIGATLGGILGQTLIPIPGVGAALGTVAGGIVGDKIFNAVVPAADEQKRAAELQMEAARAQQVAARRDSGVDVGAAGGSAFTFGDPAQFSKYITTLGLQQDAQVQQFKGLYSLDQQKQNAAAELGRKYNEEVERLRKTGLSSEKIAGELKPLGQQLNRARTEAQTSLTALNKQWDKIGADSRTKILSGADNITQALNDAAAKIREAGDPTSGNTDRNRRENVGIGGYDDYVREMQNRGIGPASYEAWLRQQKARKSWKGSLGDAISSEMKHKPPGSDLLIANSSETIIPKSGIISAASGYMPTTGMYSSSFAGRFSSPASVTNNITINQQPGEDSQALAARLAQAIWDAMKRADSVFV